ncbi:MAG: hypothetical protein RBG13Loki_1149 [Promethearchaeota archaeon CR_4]|nr:MAG: hypothetical protein RBG13Loki_1149 [Candidatus Lokiarchaeota archaeon CR_4]
MRMLGAKKRFQMNCYYWETFFLLLPSLGFAFGFRMIFVEFFFVNDLRFLPSLWVPITIMLMLLATFSFLNFLIAKTLVRRARGSPSLILQ